MNDDPLARTTANQLAAADPLASAWVSANAGAGKTHVLKTRVLRILMAGTPPERILCLTYTKAAAAEMEDRVFRDLAAYATVGQDKLAEELAKLFGRPATTDEMATARRLFARAIETPGGLKVQTIHAFCERLLQRFPLEAQVPPGFEILDDETGRQLRREAIDGVLRDAMRGDDPALADAVRTAVVFAHGDRFDEVVAEALAARAWVEMLERLGDDPDASFQALGVAYRRAFQLADDDTTVRIEEKAATVLDDGVIRRAITSLIDGKSTDQSLAARLGQALDGERPQRLKAFASAFLTGEREPRSDSKFITKAIREREAGLAEQLAQARDRFHRLMIQRDAAQTIDATLALLQISDRVMRRYTWAKRQGAMLDFDDLVQRTVGLLSSGEMTAWVLYKLDGGLDHILVDEAQDTSPLQWQIVDALAREFFAGRGAQDTVRTVFAVGDEKQSIYSFQGAEPKQFAAMGRRFGDATTAAGGGWRRLSLDLSFRTVAPVLGAVDRVFADPALRASLTSGGDPVRHIAKRIGQAGCVEVWDTEPYEAPVETEAFDPLGDRPAVAAVGRLVQRIADTIQGWLASGERLVSENRPIEPGDIMILVRRRRPFAPAMVAALKERHLPVAGADRMVIADQIAIQDLVSLGRVLALPEDDLALAEVLKSPLFDLDDDALIAIAPERPGSLYKALLAASVSDRRFEEAAAKLKAWRQIADFLPPYELYTEILEKYRMRERLLARLGVEASEAIDELLDMALAYDDRAPASLAGFLSSLATSRHEVKRDLEHGRNEIRILTVHGSKGLEAPIVFLPDTAATAKPRPGALVKLMSDRGGLPLAVWCVPGASRLAPIREARDAVAAREAEEADRLLYVAMTRARDRLYVGGWETAKARTPDCWYDKIRRALDQKLSALTLADGRVVHRLDTEQTADHDKQKKDHHGAVPPAEPPQWAQTPVRAEPQAAVPVAPSRLAPLDVDEEGEPEEHQRGHATEGAARERPSPSPAQLAGDQRFLRGMLTHTLLQYLPELPPDGWEAAAQGFLERRAAGLTGALRQSIAMETLAVLRHPAFAPVFRPGSRAEVPLVATLPDPQGLRPAIRLNGQIDRLVRTGSEVLILDYKTNRPPPTDPKDVPLAYLAQMAAYRLALAPLFPGATIRAALLWTYRLNLMELPAALLDDAQSRLWELTASP